MSYEWVAPLDTKESPADPEAILDFLLENRGIKTREAKEEFLAPDLEILSAKPPYFFKKVDLDNVIQRVRSAIADGESIFIHGDYDVDGLCGTAILWETIYYDLNYQNVYPFIPHRINHGYGLTFESLEEIERQNHSNSSKNRSNKRLLITIDCGVTAHQEIERAKNLGFDVIILDHHAQPETLPKAFAILHTEVVCAASIAWIVSQQLKQQSRPIVTTALQCVVITKDLDLVALATVADLQPLTGFNRGLAKFGLEELNRTQRLGLQTLVQAAGLIDRRLTPYEVSWMLAPRLNAMGRLDHALDSLRLLCTRNRGRALQLAQRLNQVNRERQKMTDATVEQARMQAVLQPEQPLLVLSHENWHEGIIGLIAARITEEFRRPTIAIAKGPKISKGSARSVAGVNIVEIVRLHRELLLDVGGHSQAAGFSLETENLAEFTRQISLPVEMFFKPEQAPSETQLKIDLVLPMTALTLELTNTLEKLEPHGLGNPRPVFLTRNLTVANLKLVGGQSQHLKLSLSNPHSLLTSQQLSTIGFDLGNLASELKIGDQVDVVYTIGEDDYDGQRRVQLKLRDLKKD